MQRIWTQNHIYYIKEKLKGLYIVICIANSSNCKKLSRRQLAAKPSTARKVQRLSREGVGPSGSKWRAP